ncbi:MAG TPA: hypothetical protein VIS48_01870 [Candidatus Kryptonia bacterium]
MRNKSVYVKPALFAGLIVSIINFAPGLFLINCLCCAGILGGGILAVLFFKMDLHEGESIMNIDGFYLGLWTGIFAAGFETVLNITIGPFIADIKFGMILNIFKRLFGNLQIPSDTMDLLNQAVASAKRPGLFESLTSFFLIVVAYSIFTILGALLTTAFIQNRKAKKV